jgi:hypothetical protein
LFAFIVIALMGVFSSTQRAFRARVTQTDVLEGGRAAMEQMAADLRGITPSDGGSNFISAPVNCFVFANTNYLPLYQSLPGVASPNVTMRTNVLNYFFILGRQNNVWTGTGYIVDTASPSAANSLYSLYRFYAETSVTNSPRTLFANYLALINNGQFTNMSHLVDGVAHLTLRAYDTQGRWMNEYASGYYQPYTNAQNTYFVYPPATGIGFGYGEAQFYMFSNAVPASVELELGILEDRVLARAEGLPNNQPLAAPNDRRTQYLQGQSGGVHVFRQRVSIPNVDKTAYQ